MNKGPYRLIATYTGFSEEKDAAITRAAGRGMAQSSFDPVDDKRCVDFVFATVRAATYARKRILAIRDGVGYFSLSKVIDDGF